jgi:hypothetical protein
MIRPLLPGSCPREGRKSVRETNRPSYATSRDQSRSPTEPTPQLKCAKLPICSIFGGFVGFSCTASAPELHS